MKVYKLEVDDRRYQMVGAMPGLVEKHPPTHATAPLLQNWQPLTATVNDPAKRRGDFLICGLQYLVCKREVTAAFSTGALEGVQVLPVSLEGETAPYDLWNIKRFVDALDTERTQFRPPPLSSLPAKWVFKPESFSQPMLFRTPNVSTQVLVLTGFNSPAAKDHDFYVQYRKLKLQGLKFDLVWDHD